MNLPSSAVVDRTLRGYADRGVLRGFGPGAARPGEFSFVWHGSRPLRLVCDAHGLTLRDYLPNVPARSEIYRELRQFLKQCTAAEVPAHRRIDPARNTLRCTNRGGRVSLGLAVRDGDFDHATRALLKLAHEVWLYLHSEWADYMWENFDAPLE
jgi:hypothetical protein